MATLAPQTIDQDGLVATLVAAAASQKANPGPRVFLMVKNADAAPHTITINDPTSRNPGAAASFDPDVAVAVAAGAIAFIPLPDRFADPADGGLASWAWSATTSMTVGVIQI